MPGPSPQSSKSVVDEAINDYLNIHFPALKNDPAILAEIKKQVIQDLNNQLKNFPSLASNSIALKTTVTHFLQDQKPALEGMQLKMGLEKKPLSLDNQITNILNKYHKHEHEKFEPIKTAVINEMENLYKNQPGFEHLHPHARELLLTLAIERQLNPENKMTLTPAMQNCKTKLSLLPKEYENIFKDPKVELLRQKMLNNTFDEKKDMEGLTPKQSAAVTYLLSIEKMKKLSPEKNSDDVENKEALEGVLALSNIMKMGPKQFSDLPAEEQTNIMNFGSDPNTGTFLVSTKSSDNIDLLTTFLTPAAFDQAKENVGSITEEERIRELPKPSPFKDPNSPY